MPNKTYKTKSGDTWDVIALNALGSEMLMHLMLDANPAHNYVAKFDAGVELEVPEVPAADLPKNLPPWRRA